MTADDLSIRDEEWPPTQGRPGVAQGRYGAHGNLELVSCATDSGMWVGWFNNDSTDKRSGAAIGNWSGALRFGRGDRYLSCTITQVAAGPDFLEVLALTDTGQLRRHVWSPEPGFVDHGVIASGVLAFSRLIESADGRFHAAVADTQGTWMLTTADAAPADAAYPALAFERRMLTPTSALDVDVAPHDDHVDALVLQGNHAVVLHCRDSETTRATDADAARLQSGYVLVIDRQSRVHLHALADGESLDLGTGEAADFALSMVTGEPRWEAIIRSGASLRHTRGGIAPLAQASSRTVRAAVWCPPSTATVHRDSN